MTYGEYLSFERTSDEKHEYVNGRVYSMAGGSPEHARLAASAARMLGVALAGRPCVVFSSDARVRIEATGRSTYPDLTVVCGRLVSAKDDPDAIANPTVIVEVLSETTEANDRGDKWAHYRLLPTLGDYVLVSQSTPRIEVFRREGDHWRYSDAGPGQRVQLASVGADLSVDELYRNPLA